MHRCCEILFAQLSQNEIASDKPCHRHPSVRHDLTPWLGLLQQREFRALLVIDRRALTSPLALNTLQRSLRGCASRRAGAAERESKHLLQPTAEELRRHPLRSPRAGPSQNTSRLCEQGFIGDRRQMPTTREARSWLPNWREISRIMALGDRGALCRRGPGLVRGQVHGRLGKYRSRECRSLE